MTVVGQAPEEVSRTHRIEEIWGTVIGVDIRGDLPATDATLALDAVFGWFATVDRVFSDYDIPVLW